MYSETIVINKLPLTPNSIGKASIWQSHAERHAWRKLVGFAMMGKCPAAPLKRASIVATRLSSRETDLDNTFSSFKYVIDALKFHAIIEDDKPSKIDLRCKWEKAKPKQGHIKIEITEIEVESDQLSPRRLPVGVPDEINKPKEVPTKESQEKVKDLMTRFRKGHTDGPNGAA